MNIIEWLYFRQSGNLAYYDRLTQLFNRNWWEDNKEKLNNKNLYLTVIDLDDLKKINDSYGHLEGDKLLINFSNELKKTFPYAKLCRLGGDEFLILNVNESDLLLYELLQSFNFSFGTCDTKKFSLSDALKEADVKMYQMKSYRKNKINN